jgi:hypothetical protein
MAILRRYGVVRDAVVGAALLAMCGVAAPAVGQTCPCDCNTDGFVRVDELVRGVNIAVGRAAATICPAADLDRSGAVAVNELVRCVGSALDGCDAILGGPPPGIRRYSLDPARSELLSTLPGGVEFVVTGFSGFLELRARSIFGSPTYFVDILDASEFISIAAAPDVAAICVRPLREQFPVLSAGVLYCAEGSPVGISVSQNRSIGVLGTCVDDGASCEFDDDCSGGSCFTQSDCDDADGTVDTVSGVAACIGPVVGELLPDGSAAGSLLISPDPNAGLIEGFPVEILTEMSLPCGDEPEAVGLTTVIALTTGEAMAVLENANNEPGAILTTSSIGDPFDCERWTGEDGTGALVFSAPVINSQVGGGLTDLLTTWRFED